jgi:membrane-associated phospholipid phosphatase
MTSYIIDTIGYYGPVILFATTFYFLIKRTPYLIVFTLGSIVNTLLNKMIKVITREPRPKNQIPFLENEDHSNEIEQYGFPSGYAQSVFFSLTFLAMTQKSQTIIYFMTMLCTITIYQRYKYRRHTIKQLVAGSIIGTLFSYVLVYSLEYTNKY